MNTDELNQFDACVCASMNGSQLERIWSMNKARKKSQISYFFTQHYLSLVRTLKHTHIDKSLLLPVEKKALTLSHTIYLSIYLQ